MRYLPDIIIQREQSMDAKSGGWNISGPNLSRLQYWFENISKKNRVPGYPISGTSKKKGCKKIYSLFLVFNPYVWYHTYSLIYLSYAQLGLVAIRAASRVAE